MPPRRTYSPPSLVRSAGAADAPGADVALRARWNGDGDRRSGANARIPSRPVLVGRSKVQRSPRRCLRRGGRRGSTIWPVSRERLAEAVRWNRDPLGGRRPDRRGWPRMGRHGDRGPPRVSDCRPALSTGWPSSPNWSAPQSPTPRRARTCGDSPRSSRRLRRVATLVAQGSPRGGRVLRSSLTRPPA